MSLLSYFVSLMTKPSKQRLNARALVINGKLLIPKAAHLRLSFDTIEQPFKLRILFIYYLSYYFRCALFFRLLIITDVSLDSGFNRIFHSLPIFVIYRILDEQNVFKIIITWAFNRSIMFLFKIQCNEWYHLSFLPYLITMQWQSYVLVTDNF